MDKKELTQKELECFKIANNVLYFEDNSDYCTALWEILTVLKPELFEEEECPELDFIDEDNEN